MPLFGVSTYSLLTAMRGGMTPEAAIVWLAEAGAQCIELVPMGGIDMAADPHQVEVLLAAATQADVPIVNYSIGANFLQGEAEDGEYAARAASADFCNEVARVKTHIDIAARLGIATMRTDCVGWGRPKERNTLGWFVKDMPLIAEAYRQLCDYAAPLGISVLLENHGFYINGSERVRLLVEAVARANFGIQLDMGNFECVDERARTATAACLPYATVFHVKDFYLRCQNPGEGWFASPAGRYLRGSIFGQGDLPAHAILGDVKRSGFDGPIILEFEGMEDCQQATKISLENAKRIYSEV